MEEAAETYLTPKSARDQEDRPYVKSVQVPESIKRRMPSKHYVSEKFVSETARVTTALLKHLAVWVFLQKKWGGAGSHQRCET